jgi:hypothetical protein
MSAFRPTIRRQSLRGHFAVLALVAVVARALIPTGYMPAMVDGHVQLVICEASMGAGVAHHGHHGHHDHQGQTHGAADSPCPFALSGGAAPLPELATTTLATAAVASHSLFIPSAPIPEAPARYTAPRGPPSLA